MLKRPEGQVNSFLFNLLIDEDIVLPTYIGDFNALTNEKITEIHGRVGLQNGLLPGISLSVYIGYIIAGDLDRFLVNLERCSGRIECIEETGHIKFSLKGVDRLPGRQPYKPMLNR